MKQRKKYRVRGLGCKNGFAAFMPLVQYTIIMLLLVGCSIPLAAQSAEIISPEARDAQMKAGFESEQLSARQILAFQQKATQLVTDFIAYCDLLRNAELEADLRDEVIREMQGLFSSPTDTIILDRPYQVSELSGLDITRLPEYVLDEVVALEVPVRITFQEMEFPLSITWVGRSVAGSSSALLFRTRKVFGAKTLSVWDVQLTALFLGAE